MKKILILFAIWVFLLHSLNLISYKLLFDRTSYELPIAASLSYRHIFIPWLNYDGLNYLQIIQNGYNPNYQTELRVFFPLYPLIVKLISFNVFNPIPVGLGISLLAIFASLFSFHYLLKLDKTNQEQRTRILTLLLLFPTSYYFLAFYTESIFLLLALLIFITLKQKRFLLAGVLTALITATRITGLALVPVFFWECYQYYRKTKKLIWQIFLAPMGFFLYLLYAQFNSGSALAIINSQKNWNRPLGILGPCYAFKDGLSKFLFGSSYTHHDLFGRSMEIVEFLTAIFLVIMIIYGFKRLKTSYWLYIFFSSVPIFFSGALPSIHRYVLVMFPIYILLGQNLSKKKFYLLSVFFAALLIYFTALYLRNYWVA